MYGCKGLHWDFLGSLLLTRHCISNEFLNVVNSKEITLHYICKQLTSQVLLRICMSSLTCVHNSTSCAFTCNKFTSFSEGEKERGSCSEIVVNIVKLDNGKKWQKNVSILFQSPIHYSLQTEAKRLCSNEMCLRNTERTAHLRKEMTVLQTEQSHTALHLFFFFLIKL